MIRHIILALVTLLIAIIFAIVSPPLLWFIIMGLILILWLIYLVVFVPRQSAATRGWAALTACFVIVAVLASFVTMFYLQANPATIRFGKEVSFLPFVEFKEYSIPIDPQLASVLIGPMVGLMITLFFFLLIGVFSSIYILALHEEMSFGEALRSFFLLILDMQRPWLLVENGDYKEIKPKGYTSNWLSRGKIIVKPGNAIVLEKGGSITGIYGPGVIPTVKDEMIRTVFDLRLQSKLHTLENVITADKIPLKIVLSVSYRITQAANPNLPGVVKEKNFGLFPVERETLRRAAFNGGTGCWKSFGEYICVGLLRDQIMAHRFDEIFEIQGSNPSISIRVNDRQVKHIEQAIMDTVNSFADATMGITISSVDIREITIIPERIREKITTEITTLVEERIKQTQAKYIVTEARAQAQAKMLEGRGEGEARAAFFREVLQELRREGALEDTELINAVLKQMISTMVSVQDLQTFVKATAYMEQLAPKRLRDGLKEANGHGSQMTEVQ